MSHHIDRSHDDEDEPLITGINITPFVDVMLVLLVIFMVTSHMIEQASGIKIQLPKATTAERVAQQKQYQINVSASGQYIFHGQTLSLTQLNAQFSAMRLQEKWDSLTQNIPIVTVGADASVAYDKVVHLMDMLRRQGIQDFALQMDQNSDSK